MSPIAEAASVLLARGPGSQEVFVVRRAAQLRFFGGFIAFPGGKVSPGDGADLAQEAERPLTVRRRAAARELFEETGVLLTRKADGSFISPSADLERCRHELIAERLLFSDLLSQFALTVRETDFTPIGAFITPPFTPIRFDTTFFVAQLPPGQHAAVWPGELDEGRWTTAAQLLDEWTAGECLVSPPTLHLLEALRGYAVEEAPARLAPYLSAHQEGALPIIFYAPAVQMIPLATVALPPSTHTNAYLVGTGPVYLLDPGPAEKREQQRLFDLLDMEQAGGRGLTAVVLSHQHPDHIGAANACAERYRVPIWAHPRTAAALQGKIDIARTLDDGECLELGTTPDGSGSWHLEAMHTPGHAAGHLAFFEPHYRLLFAGDMVSTLSSVVIAPPDGDLAVYLASLRRLREYDCRLLLPSHGSPSASSAQTIEECLVHRARREKQLLAALSAAPRTLADLATELYKGVPAHLMRFARLQVLAGLQKVEREGRVAARDQGGELGWFRSPTN